MDEDRHWRAESHFCNRYVLWKIGLKKLADLIAHCKEEEGYFKFPSADSYPFSLHF